MVALLDTKAQISVAEVQMSPKLAQLSTLFIRYFPEWNVGIFPVAAQIVSDIQSLAAQLNLNSNLNGNPANQLDVAQVIPFAVDHKLVDLIGTIGGSIQGELVGREEYLVKVLGRVVFLLLDVPDTLGDSIGIRDTEDTKILFSFAEYVFTGVKPTLNTLTNSKYQPLIHFLKEYSEETKKGVDEMFSKLESRESEAKARTIIADMIKQYRDSVSIMHVQDENLRNVLKDWYLKQSVINGREILPWLKNPDLWVLSQITTLGIIGVLNEVSTKSEITVEELTQLEAYYDQVTSFTLIALDGIKDLIEDEENGDSNLFKELLEGKHIYRIAIMEDKYGKIQEFAGYENDRVVATKYFYALLGRAYLEKEIYLVQTLGSKRAYKHQKMFRDMVKFYRLQLQMEGKGQETLESQCMQILTNEIGNIN